MEGAAWFCLPYTFIGATVAPPPPSSHQTAAGQTDASLTILFEDNKDIKTGLCPHARLSDKTLYLSSAFSLKFYTKLKK